MLFAPGRLDMPCGSQTGLDLISAVSADRFTQGVGGQGCLYRPDRSTNAAAGDIASTVFHVKHRRVPRSSRVRDVGTAQGESLEPVDH